MFSSALSWASWQSREERLKSIFISSLTLQMRKLVLNGINVLDTARKWLGQVLFMGLYIPFCFFSIPLHGNSKIAVWCLHSFVPEVMDISYFAFIISQFGDQFDKVTVHLILFLTQVQFFVNPLLHDFVTSHQFKCI